MKLNPPVLPPAFTALAAGLLLAWSPSLTSPAQAADKIEVGVFSRVDQIVPPVPISVSGFPADVHSVLDFHLTVCGFKLVPAEQAEFQLTGSGAANLEGTLITKNGGASLFARSFAGGTRRSQSHALADEVTKTINGQVGLGQSRLAFRRILDRRNRHNEKISEIFVCDFDGFEPVQLTQDGVINASPDWIPGMRGLVYMSNRDGNSDIYSHDLGTGARAPVARYSGSNLSPSVSPDGRRVAMALSRGGNVHLWVSNLDGSGATQLTRGQIDASSPCWSPNGETICFASTGGGTPLIHTIPARGGTAKRLATGMVGVTEPDWSPDGKWIAFTRMTKGENFKIYVVPAAGGVAQEVGDGEDPSWGPNSRTLAINVRKNNERRLRLLDVPTRQYKDLTLNSGSCSQPSWGR